MNGPSEGLKGISWEPKRTTRLTSENAGLPKGRESHGNGTPIVVSNADEGAGLEGVQEHRTDNAMQGRYRRALGGERSARCDQLTPY